MLIRKMNDRETVDDMSFVLNKRFFNCRPRIYWRSDRSGVSTTLPMSWRESDLSRRKLRMPFSGSE
jgi:hypothetical protein